ncbi:MAG: hypothetical protein P4L03_00265 [Terracidiphilus sp.]|nr:hypothetical protein [Terracidiphilus sp.]
MAKMRHRLQDDQCRLCLREHVKLQDSHFLPKGLYKRLRDESQKNPNPVLVTKNTVVQTSEQMSEYLLCGECEQRLNRNGERWILGNCLQGDGSFPLETTLTCHPPDISSLTSATRVYFASRYPDINVDAIAYFAASIFWRGSIHPWSEDGEKPVRFGPIQERFRQYLLGVEPFPHEASLSVVVRTNGKTDRITYGPSGKRKKDIRHFRFTMPGLVFLLFCGPDLPENIRNASMVHNDSCPISIAPMLEERILDEIRPLFIGKQLK